MSFLRPRLLHLWRLFKGDSKLYFPMWKACGQRICPCNILRWVSLAVWGCFWNSDQGWNLSKKISLLFEWLALIQPTFIGCQALQHFSVSLNYMALTLCTCTFLCMSNRLHTLIYTIRVFVFCNKSSNKSFEFESSELHISIRQVHKNKTMTIIRRDESAKT